MLRTPNGQTRTLRAARARIDATRRLLQRQSRFEGAPCRAAMALARCFAHIDPMASRPCRPSVDVKGLWQVFLPGTPFPSCGVAEEAETDSAQRGDDASADLSKDPKSCPEPDR